MYICSTYLVCNILKETWPFHKCKSVFFPFSIYAGCTGKAETLDLMSYVYISDGVILTYSCEGRSLRLLALCRHAALSFLLLQNSKNDVFLVIVEVFVTRWSRNADPPAALDCLRGSTSQMLVLASSVGSTQLWGLYYGDSNEIVVPFFPLLFFPFRTAAPLLNQSFFFPQHTSSLPVCPVASVEHSFPRNGAGNYTYPQRERWTQSGGRSNKFSKKLLVYLKCLVWTGSMRKNISTNDNWKLIMWFVILNI